MDIHLNDPSPNPRPLTRHSRLVWKMHCPFCPVCSRSNRIPAHVQVAIRSRFDQPLYTVGLNVIDRPFTPVSIKTTALTPLVFQNESHVWLERKNTRLVSENILESFEFTPKQLNPPPPSCATRINAIPVPPSRLGGEEWACTERSEGGEGAQRWLESFQSKYPKSEDSNTILQSQVRCPLPPYGIMKHYAFNGDA